MLVSGRVEGSFEKNVGSEPTDQIRVCIRFMFAKG